MLDITVKPQKPLIAASILASDFADAARDARDALAKGADLLHLDVMDGHFVPNLTMGADMIRGLRKHLPGVYLDVHLMVERPQDYIESFAEAGANNFSFHLEVCKDLRESGLDATKMIRQIRDHGMNAGLVINPPTAAQPLEPYLDLLDVVLVMSVNPGLGGQSFIPEVLDKTRWISERIGPGTRLEMDGGLNAETVGDAIDAGMDMIVAGTAVFDAADRAQAIRQLREAGRANQPKKSLTPPTQAQ